MHVVKKVFLVLTGLISLGIGVTGFFFPILPATPFLIVAAFCFARSSKRLHSWLMTHGFLGPYISGFLYGTPLPRRVKRIAIVLLWIGVVIPSAAVWHQFEKVRFIAAALTVFLAVGVGFTIYLARLPVCEDLGRPYEAPQV